MATKTYALFETRGAPLLILSFLRFGQSYAMISSKVANPPGMTVPILSLAVRYGFEHTNALHLHHAVITED